MREEVGRRKEEGSNAQVSQRAILTLLYRAHDKDEGFCPLLFIINKILFVERPVEVATPSR